MISAIEREDQLDDIVRVCFGFVDGHHQKERPVSMPLSIASLLREIKKPLTVQFERCLFEPRQAEHLAKYINKDSLIRFDHCGFPLEGMGNDIFMKNISKRQDPIKISYYESPVFVGIRGTLIPNDDKKDCVVSKVAGLMMLKHLAKEGKISQLSIDTEFTEYQTFGYDELVEYLEILDVLGGKLLVPNELKAATGVNEHSAGVYVSKFHSESVSPPWEGRYTDKMKPCGNCERIKKFCYRHDWKATAAAVVERLLDVSSILLRDFCRPYFFVAHVLSK